MEDFRDLGDGPSSQLVSTSRLTNVQQEDPRHQGAFLHPAVPGVLAEAAIRSAGSKHPAQEGGGEVSRQGWEVALGAASLFGFFIAMAVFL